MIVLIGMLASSTSSCRDRSETIAPEPVARNTRVAQTISVDSSSLDWTLFYRARIVPELARGQVLGIRIFIDDSDAGSEPGFGVRMADRIQAIDGVPARTTQAVIDAYSRIRAMHEVQLDVHRRGRSLRIIYRPSGAALSR